MTAAIRRYRDSDRAAVYDVCVQTADAGRSVRGRYRTDGLVPDVFAGPYLLPEPAHAYVLDNGERAVGYVLGTASTPDFVAAYTERWLPWLGTRYPPLPGPPQTEEEHRLDAMFTPNAGCGRNWHRTRRTCTSTCSPATGGRVTGGS